MKIDGYIVMPYNYPSIVVKTKKEAVKEAKKFVIAEQLDVSDWDTEVEIQPFVFGKELE